MYGRQDTAGVDDDREFLDCFQLVEKYFDDNQVEYKRRYLFQVPCEHVLRDIWDNEEQCDRISMPDPAKSENAGADEEDDHDDQAVEQLMYQAWMDAFTAKTKNYQVVQKLPRFNV